MTIYKYLVVGETVKQAEHYIKTFDEIFRDKCKAISITVMKRTEPVPAMHIVFTESFGERADIKDVRFARNYFGLCRRLANGLLEEST
ncbi:hypothetical protein GM526_20260 [Enterococcus avium]|uniref:hypothetical protein n=1 Tax=Enterococcus avium TaxID=33945 RepID=UPI00159DE4BD|nr:hypothetical protein [Enterococcus avium]NVN79384.1 hypothetical protein [Enterococcus avium]